MVLRNLDQKQKAYGTLIFFVALALIFYFVSDSFSAWASTSNPWLVLVISILLNPAYAFLIYYLYKSYSFRGVIAGILISISVDIISLTHSIKQAGILPLDAQTQPLYGYADTLFFKIIYPYTQGMVATFILYVLLPSLIFYLALRVIRKTAKFNKIVREAI